MLTKASPARLRLAAAAAAPRRAPLDVAALLLDAGPLVILLVAVVVMRALSPVFLTTENLQNVGTQASIVAILAVGQLLVILVRGIDISVGSVVGFSTALAMAVVGGAGAAALIALTLAGGLAVGLVNGLLVVKGRIAQPLIVTVAMLGVVRGLALMVSSGAIVVGVPAAVATAGSDQVGPIPVPVLIAAGVALVLWVATRRLLWGSWLYAVGGNPEAATRLGIPTGAVTISAYALCSMTAAIAAIVVAGRTGTIDPNAGTLYEIDAITAVVLGGASLSGGRGSVLNVAVGALVLGVIRNGLNLLDVSPYWQMIAIGALVLVALELDVLRRHVDTRLKARHAGEVEA